MTLAKILPDIAAEKLGQPKPLIVGVKDVPIRCLWFTRQVLTKQSAFVRLYDERGIHASRLTKTLFNLTDTELTTLPQKPSFITNLKQTHNTDINYSCSFDDFLIVPGIILNRKLEYSDQWYTTIKIPYISTCPCASEMCKQTNIGIPHQQRSIMKVTTLWTKNLIQVENALLDLFLMPQSIMTREDELDWCIRASENKNLVFCEDAARKIGEVLESFDHTEYLIECEHFESLHSHSMVAVNRKGRFL